MKRKLAAAGLAAVLSLSVAACDTVDDPGVDDTGLNGDIATTVAPDLTVPPADTTPTTTPTTAAG
ncbi:MAG TPA: hypothetical protein VJ938_04525 [Acidimicrobiia bacterium]|jgi:hypothetical protein|nr:hypothetical protein [Acidimicrobiia bacterium]